MENLRKLNRDEMKNLKGGYMLPPDTYSGGHCTDGNGNTVAGTWTYPDGPVSLSACSTDVRTYCSSGSGVCSVSAT
jgi:hypothetical protein